MERKHCVSLVSRRVGAYTWSLVGFSLVSDKVSHS